MPFISLYLTQTFSIGLMEAGIIFLIVGIGNVIGGMVGGALTDKFGRKTMALYGLVISGLFSLVMMFITNLMTLYIVVGIMGLVGSLGGPARGAMIADVLPPEQRAEGYGILRIVANVSATIGPAIGGFLATQNFNWIFIGDAIASALTAIVFIIMVPETKPADPEPTESTAEESLIDSEPLGENAPAPAAKKSGGYRDVFLDWQFMFFIGACMLMNLVYMNMNFSLPVFLNVELGIEPKIYGWVISMNAFMVVIMQFFITRKVKKFQALIMIAVGNLLYGIGFVMYGFISSIPMVFIAMVVITIGEMIIAPFAQAIAANFAPADKRGRYMAVFNFSGLVPMMFGNIMFGAIMDNIAAVWVWYVCGMLSILAVGLYLLLHKVAKARFANQETPSADEDEELQRERVYDFELESTNPSSAIKVND